MLFVEFDWLCVHIMDIKGWFYILIVFLAILVSGCSL